MAINIKITSPKIQVKMQSIWSTGGTVIINDTNFLWFLDATTNTATKGNTTINPAVVSATAPIPAQWYYVVSVGGALNRDLVWTVSVGQIVLFPNNLRAATNDLNASLQAHISNTSNPHVVTPSQIWLWSVNNTSDLNKPISTATQTALDSKSNIGHTHTIAQVVDLTAELALKAPVSHSHTIGQVVSLQTSLDNKVNVLTPTVTLTTVNFIVDRIHGLYGTPITWNITASTTAGVAWVVCHVFHNSGTSPTISWATRHSGFYVVSTLNFIQFMFDGTTVFYTITPNA